MSGPRPIYLIQRDLDAAHARATALASPPVPPTTILPRKLIAVQYYPVLLVTGTVAAQHTPSIKLQASESAVNFFTAAALHLSTDQAVLDVAEAKPRGYRPTMVRAMIADPTPSRVKAFKGTGRSYIKYAQSSTGTARAFYNAPLSTAAADGTQDQLITSFKAIVAAKKAAVGDYGRISMELERLVFNKG